MPDELISILKNPAVAERVSGATRDVLQQRAHPAPYQQFLDAELFVLLQIVVDVVLPQNAIGTQVNLAEAIDRRLAGGTNAGWRYAELPPDGAAYQQGLTLLATTLEATPMKSLNDMPRAACEAYLRCVAQGDVDAVARFPLSKFMQMLRTDVVRMWMSHPSTMQALNLYSFADGVTGSTDGPTATEGWSELTPGTAKDFEQGKQRVEREA